MLDRREFIKITVASLPLPFVRMADQKAESYWHLTTGEFFPVDDPVAWALENAKQPILERARKGLLKLSSQDHTRIIRLVTRRCGLNLIEVQPQHVVVHHWGRTGLVQLSPFFKQLRLARPEVEVVLIDRKRETSTIKVGDDFLYGERLIAAWPIQPIWSKWQRRHQKESDDWTAAPNTGAGYGWNGIKPNRIPWAALKSAWRKATPYSCPNCEQPTILVNFGMFQSGMLRRMQLFIWVCRHCSRTFYDGSVQDVNRWLVMNLDADVLPNAMIVWGRPIKWEPPNVT